jgi:hypothetical protein
MTDRRLGIRAAPTAGLALPKAGSYVAEKPPST